MRQDWIRLSRHFPGRENRLEPRFGANLQAVVVLGRALAGAERFDLLLDLVAGWDPALGEEEETLAEAAATVVQIWWRLRRGAGAR